jgi:hypothetical protein
MSELFLHKFLGVRLDFRVTLGSEDMLYNLVSRHLVSFLF